MLFLSCTRVYKPNKRRNNKTHFYSRVYIRAIQKLFCPPPPWNVLKFFHVSLRSKGQAYITTRKHNKDIFPLFTTIPFFSSLSFFLFSFLVFFSLILPFKFFPVFIFVFILQRPEYLSPYKFEVWFVFSFVFKTEHI